MKNIKNWIWILLAVLLASFLISYGRNSNISFNFFGSSPQKVAQKAVDFINKNYISNGEAKLVKVEEDSGVYKFTLKIGSQQFDSYVTKNGKYLFPQGVNLTETTNQANQQPSHKSCADLKKTNKPLLEAFVVARCPFGLQMERVLSRIVQKIPQLASYIKVEFIGDITDGKITSMHGEEEAQENLRQICLREEQPDTFWPYLACHIKEGEVDSCLVSAKVDEKKLAACMSDNQRGLAYAAKDFENQNKYQVTGSPTLILNGETVSEFDFGGRTAEAVKTLLCCGFSKQPDFCSQKLTTDSAATGFSSSYSDQSGSNSNSSCN